MLDPGQAQPQTPPQQAPRLPPGFEVLPTANPTVTQELAVTETQPRTGDFLKPYFGGHNPIAETYDTFIEPFTEVSSDRPIAERAMDTVNFAASVPLRALRLPSVGELGEQYLGDPSLRESEERFIENNPKILQAIGAAGEVAAGAGGSFGQGFVRNPIPRPSTRVGTDTGRSVSGLRADQMDVDLRAFRDQGVRRFSPAFMDGPGASIGKQLTETPVVGAPLRNNMAETFTDAAAAVNRLADDVAPNATAENAGLNVQRGLDRFRDQPFHELEPGIVRRLGIDPNSPVQRQQGGGQAQIQRIQQGRPIVEQVTGGQTQTSRGAPAPLARTRAERLTQRTRVEDLSDAELSRVVRTSADDTSFSTRLEALYEGAFRKLPPLLRRDGSVNGNLLPTANSGRVVQEIVGDEARTGVRAGVQGRYGQMFERLANPQSNVTLGDLRAMRTAIGRELSNFGLYDASLDRTQLRRLYGSLSEDIAVGMQDLATRAAQATRIPGNNRLSVADAQRASQAVRELQVADRFARAGFERMDRFLSLVRANNPQQVADGLIRAATEGKGGNMRQFRAAMRVLRPEERAEFGALAIRRMGQPEARGTGLISEVGFSPGKFVTAYNTMSPEARNMLFNQSHRATLNQLFRVAHRLAHVEAQTNFSRSGTNALNMSGLAAGVAALAAGNVAVPAAVGGSGVLLSYLLSRPKTTQWLVKYARLRANVRSGTSRNANALYRHFEKLIREAPDNPQLQQAILAAYSQEMEVPTPTQ